MAGGGAVSAGSAGICGVCTDCKGDGGVMSYVGSSGGDYIMETTYRYVGNGLGEFQVNEPKEAGGMNYCRVAGCMSVGVVVAFAVVLFWPAGGMTSTTSHLL